ncbi:hypothetical protein [Chitinophaga filiformis]|uniref:Uncharacterized protein n=1 Tax=Chitinophaga filiformis TaxID=104663 RepID=A0ABY4I0X7_CHIFI|nr:hypothetical protein [Chitinophaga filiformis]UPK69742.1 hypothetical protein MYF79_00375 [Chitinophaga filiformis]
MNDKLNRASKRGKRTQHGTSNTILIITLLLIPLLQQPVSSLRGSVRIIFEQQQTGGQDTPPLTIHVQVKDELIPIGCTTLLMLAFFYVRKRENALQDDNQLNADTVMSDDEVLAAWNEVKKRLLSDDDEA